MTKTSIYITNINPPFPPIPKEIGKYYIWQRENIKTAYQYLYDNDVDMWYAPGNNGQIFDTHTPIHKYTKEKKHVDSYDRAMSIL